MRGRKGMRLGAILSVFALATTMMTGVAGAVGSAETPTDVTVGGQGEDVFIECIWALMDTNDAAAGMQYGEDDDRTLDNLYPCDLGHGSPSGSPAYDVNDIDLGNPKAGVIQVRANAEDDPMQRIELWMAIDHNTQGADAITSVFVDVFHPDGSPKVQVHLDRTVCDGPEWGYNPVTGAFTNNTMWDAAVRDTKQISLNALSDANDGILTLCAEGQKGLWKGTFELSKHQPCGPYALAGFATDNYSYDSIHSYLYVECWFNLETDFAQGLSFPTVAPGNSAKIFGDLNFSPGDGDPTVRNSASGGMNVTVKFTALCGNRYGPLPCNDVNAKKVTEFDAKFTTISATLVNAEPTFDPANGTGICADKFAPGGEYCPNSPNAVGSFGFGDYKTVCANEVGKLDLSAYIPADRGILPGAKLAGKVIVLGSADGGTDGADDLPGAAGSFGNNQPGLLDQATYDSTWPKYTNRMFTCNNDNWRDVAGEPAFGSPSKDQRNRPPAPQGHGNDA